MRPHRVGLCTGVAILVFGAVLCFGDAGATEKQPPLGEFLSRVCPDGHDEDWRSEGPVLWLTGEWRGGDDSDHHSTKQTPFVLYGDGTIIAGGPPAHGKLQEGWRHTKYHLGSGAVAELMRSLNWTALLELDDDYHPIQKEQALWWKVHTCFDACWPYLELHLWSEGCIKTISLDGLDAFYLQLIATGRRKPDAYPDFGRFEMARLAFNRLPPALKQALLQLVRFKSSRGTPWCKGESCFTQRLPWL